MRVNVAIAYLGVGFGRIGIHPVAMKDFSVKRVLVTVLSIVMLSGAGRLLAADINYASGYSGSLGGGMMTTMLDFMEWFLGQRNNSGRPVGRWSNPSGFNGFNQGPGDFQGGRHNPWVQVLEGTWQAQSGEYWYVRGNRFVLLDNNKQKMVGEFVVEGDFILTRMPWGEVEFEFRQMDDVLLMRDVNGRIMLLQRIESGGWDW